jgi:hypothetical protein
MTTNLKYHRWFELGASKYRGWASTAAALRDLEGRGLWGGVSPERRVSRN